MDLTSHIGLGVASTAKKNKNAPGREVEPYNGAASGGGLVFPILKNADIISFVQKQFGNLELTETELDDPGKHKKKVRSIFERLVSIVCP
jgi:hypothetical protein